MRQGRAYRRRWRRHGRLVRRQPPKFHACGRGMFLATPLHLISGFPQASRQAHVAAQERSSHRGSGSQSWRCTESRVMCSSLTAAVCSEPNNHQRRALLSEAVFLCSREQVSDSPFSADHSLSERSCEAVARIRSFGATATALMSLSCAICVYRVITCGGGSSELLPLLDVDRRVAVTIQMLWCEQDYPPPCTR